MKDRKHLTSGKRGKVEASSNGASFSGWKKVVADLLSMILSTRDLRDRLPHSLPLYEYLSSSTLHTNLTNSNNLVHLFQPLEHVCRGLKAYTVLPF